MNQGYGNGLGQGMGQNPISPEQYGQALQAFEVLNSRQNKSDQMNASGNPFAILGNALGGLVSGKFGKYKDQSLSGVSDQIEQFHAQNAAQAQAQQEAKDMAKAKAKYERDKADEIEKYNRDQGGRMEALQFGVDNRAAPQARQPSQIEQMKANMSTEQWQSYMNKQAGMQQGGQMFSQEEQGLIKAGKVTPEQLMEVKKNEALNIKPEKELTGELRIKLALLDDAEKSLAAYEKEAFKDGDYQEIGSLFGATEAKLKNAMDNVVRIETGAGKSASESQESIDKYAPSMFRSDETNAEKIKLFKDKINQLRNGIRGNSQQPQQAVNNQAPAADQTNALLGMYGGK